MDGIRPEAVEEADTAALSTEVTTFVGGSNFIVCEVLKAKN